MRSKQSQRNLPVTARTLETIIRLSSANAKARLSHSVDDCDVEVAVELINFVVFHEAGLVAPEEIPGKRHGMACTRCFNSEPSDRVLTCLVLSFWDSFDRSCGGGRSEHHGGVGG